MNRHPYRKHSLPTACTVVLATCGALAHAAEKAEEESFSYRPLALENRSLQSNWQTAYAGSASLGLGYTSNDNYRFGEYNGTSKQEATIIGELQWQELQSGSDYWQLSLSNLGLDTRQGELTWGRSDQLRISLGFDTQQQVRNNSGKTPFQGNANQTLPGNWISGQNTTDFANLGDSLHAFERVLNRDKLFLAVNAKLDDNWRLESKLSYEQKEGHGDLGAGIYIDGASTDAVLLRSPVDYGTTEFELSLSYDGAPLHLNWQLVYSDFTNNDQLLVWRNPYSSFGPNVSYPDGTGGVGLPADNEQTRGRLSGHYIFSNRARLQFDGSYALATQDDNYPEYTVNQALVGSEPLPRQDFGGEVAISTGSVRLLLNPLRKLSVQLFYKLRDRNYDIERDGYRYVRGDGNNQPGAAQTVYNTQHDLTTQTAGIDASYRLPLRGKLGFEYAYEEVDRRNAAVQKTEEDRYTLKYRIQPWSHLSARLQIEFADRAADTYEWAQDYYALLDAQLINATPDSQRYINHPLLSTHYLANRERWEGKVDLSYLPSERWNLNLNLLWQEEDYDKTILGLNESSWQRVHFSAGYSASNSLQANVFTSYGRYESDQRGRTFRGGQEKDAFAIYPPLPQASDPQQDWDVAATDTSTTLGANLQWQYAPDLELNLEYSFVDTQAEQAIATQPGASASASDLPSVNTRLHQVQASATWQIRKHLSLQLDYQFYSYTSDDWAWENVQADTIARVLTFGQTNPNEDIQYVGASVIYRWQ